MCDLCAAVERYERIPAVAVVLARLKDELAVQEMVATSSPAARATLGRLADWKKERRDRVAHWRTVLDSLAYGPLPLLLLDEDIHGPPCADHLVMTRRREKTRNVLRRLVVRQLVVRVGWSTYALPHVTEGMVDRDREDARRMLTETGHGRPPEGWTVPELADRCDAAPSTVQGWIKAFRLEGLDVVVTYGRRAGHHGQGFARYLIRPAAPGRLEAPTRLRQPSAAAAG